MVALCVLLSQDVRIIKRLLEYDLIIFFFKQKTAYEMRISDWSSDVCSSDLVAVASDQHDVCPVRDEGRCCGKSDAAAAAEDHKRLAPHPEVHRCSAARCRIDGSLGRGLGPPVVGLAARLATDPGAEGGGPRLPEPSPRRGAPLPDVCRARS